MDYPASRPGILSWRCFHDPLNAVTLAQVSEFLLGARVESPHMGFNFMSTVLQFFLAESLIRYINQGFVNFSMRSETTR